MHASHCFFFFFKVLHPLTVALGSSSWPGLSRPLTSRVGTATECETARPLLGGGPGLAGPQAAGCSGLTPGLSGSRPALSGADGERCGAQGLLGSGGPLSASQSPGPGWVGVGLGPEPASSLLIRCTALPGLALLRRHAVGGGSGGTCQGREAVSLRAQSPRGGCGSL